MHRPHVPEPLRPQAPVRHRRGLLLQEPPRVYVRLLYPQLPDDAAFVADIERFVAQLCVYLVTFHKRQREHYLSLAYLPHFQHHQRVLLSPISGGGWSGRGSTRRRGRLRRWGREARGDDVGDDHGHDDERHEGNAVGGQEERRPGGPRPEADRAWPPSSPRCPCPRPAIIGRPGRWERAIPRAAPMNMPGKIGSAAKAAERDAVGGTLAERRAPRAPPPTRSRRAARGSAARSGRRTARRSWACR